MHDGKIYRTAVAVGVFPSDCNVVPGDIRGHDRFLAKSKSLNKMDTSTASSVIEQELDSDEKLLWSDVPDARRMMLPAIPIVLFGLGWNAFMINFIYMWNNGQQNVQGPGGLFGMQGILGNMFFIPFIAVGLGTLLAPFWIYRSAKNTAYGISDKRVLIVTQNWSKRVQSFCPKDVSEIQRIERNDGTGDLILGRQIAIQSESSANFGLFRLAGIKSVRTVEKLLRELVETNLIAGQQNQSR